MPTAFLSYSWDPEPHPSWVRELAARLRKDGIETTLDQWHAIPGDNLPYFMERAIRENDYVIVICSPAYKRKSDDRRGGVGYEGDIMTGEAFVLRNRRKFIPVLREGEWASAAPSWLLGSYYIDLRGPSWEDRYHLLADTLHHRLPEPPPIQAQGFTLLPDKTVLDTTSSLVWCFCRSTLLVTVRSDIPSIIRKQCEESGFNWRLPTREEISKVEEAEEYYPRQPIMVTQPSRVPANGENLTRALSFESWKDPFGGSIPLSDSGADISELGYWILNEQHLLRLVRAVTEEPDSYWKTRVTYLTPAPARILNYLERAEQIRALRDEIFAEDDRKPIAVTALVGMGGIGKTVLARAFTDDMIVLRAFPDGIVWVNAGKEKTRDLIEDMCQIAKGLGNGSLCDFKNTPAKEYHYRITIANKAGLIVIDDVSSKADIEPLLAESPRTRFLFTTRDASVARSLGAREHRADLLDLALSRQLFASWANVPTAELPASVDEVIAQCGRLPLALSVVGAMLRGADTDLWSNTLDLLRNAGLSATQERLPSAQESCFKAMEVSFRKLKPELQERYKELATLLEDMAAPPRILATLWNVDEAEARQISQHFADRSLAQSHGAQEGIGLHDLQLEYVRALYPDKQALELIHGAVRLSSNVLAKDPGQFASQIVGRLLMYQNVPAIAEFCKRIAESTHSPWLRSTQPTLDPPVAGLLRTLTGHSDRVTALAVTPDGQQAVSASMDQTLKVWDLASGSELRTLSGHSDGVRAVAVTPDGRRAVSASDDQTLKVWDLASGSELRTLSGHLKMVNAVAVTPDGQQAVSASMDQTLKVWDLASGSELRTLRGLSGYSNAVAVTPDGQRAVSASWGNTLKVWDLASGQELRTLTGHSKWVNAVAVTPDGQRAVSASEDQTLKLWDLASGSELRTLTGHRDEVRAVAVTSDGQRAISACTDNTVRMWKLETRELFATFTCDGAADCCAFSDALDLIVAGDAGGHVHFLHLEKPKPRN